MKSAACFLIMLCATASAQVEWTVRTSGTSHQIGGVAFGNGVFLAAAGRPLRSEDGLTWSKPTWPGSETIQSVMYGDGGFVAFGGREVETYLDPNADAWMFLSTDGITATRHSASPWVASFPTVQGACIDGTWLFVGLFDHAANRAPLLRKERNSSALVAVTELPSTEDVYWVAAIGEEFLIGTNSAIFASSDGKAWSLRCRGNSGQKPIQKGDSLFIYASVSTDAGKTWVRHESHYEPYNPSALLYAAGHFVAANDGLISTSPDALTWTEREPGTPDLLTDLAFGNNTFVAVGLGGRITTSSALNPLPEVAAPGLAIAPSIMLKWPSIAGRWYQVENSPDMQTWTKTADLIPGTGADIQRAYEQIGDRKYFRVSVR